jgi:hypothetical protein
MFRRFAVAAALLLACGDDTVSTSASTSSTPTTSISDPITTGTPDDTGTPTGTSVDPTSTSWDPTTGTTSEPLVTCGAIPAAILCPPVDPNIGFDLDMDGRRDTLVHDQAELAILAGCTDILGSLYIEAGVSDLTALADLRCIGGTLVLSGPLDNESALTSLAGLEGLESVGGLRLLHLAVTSLEPLAGLKDIPNQLEVAVLPDLESLEGLHNIEHVGELSLSGLASLLDLTGLRGLQRVDTHFNLSSLNLLTDLHGLETLAEVGDPGGEPSLVTLGGMHALTSADGLEFPWHDAHAVWITDVVLPDLSLLAGAVELHSLLLQYNDELVDLDGLDSLQVVHDTFTVEKHAALTDFGPLPALQQPGEVRLDDLSELTSLSGLAGLTTLRSLVIEDVEALTGLADLSALTQVERSLEIRSDNALSTLADISALTSIGGHLTIVVNPALLQTEAVAWGAAIDVGTYRKIVGNKGDLAPPADPCPWVEDGECDEGGVCAKGTDEADCVFGD